MWASTSAARRVAISSCCSVRRMRVKSAANATVKTTSGATKANSSMTAARSPASRLLSFFAMLSSFTLFNFSTFQW